MVWDETRFAPVGFDSFYSMQLIQTIHTELAFFDPKYNVTTYDTPVTMVNLLAKGSEKAADNSTIGFVGVSFAYQTLSQQDVIFAVQYTISSLFGDLSAVVAAAMGIDLIKISVGVCLLYYALRKTDVSVAANFFNS